MKRKGLWILAAVVFTLVVFRWNRSAYIKNVNGDIALTRVDRYSVIGQIGTYYTPGLFKSFFFEPTSHVKMFYTDGGPFDSGCYQIYARYDADTVTIYHASTLAATKGLNPKFRTIKLEAFAKPDGGPTWMEVKENAQGIYRSLNCNSDIP